MRFSLSLLASVAVLSFPTTSHARVPRPRNVQSQSALEVEGSDQADPSPNRLERRQDSNVTVELTNSTVSAVDLTNSTAPAVVSSTAVDECYDRYVNALIGLPPPDAQTFCNIWNNIGPATTWTDTTPVITSSAETGSTRTEWSTLFTTTTQYTTETETVTAGSAMRRAVAPRFNNVAATVNAIVTSVLSSGTEGAIASTAKGSDRALLETSLTHACSCLDVDPTDTSTFTNTAPPSVAVIKTLVNRRTTETTTKLYTTTITVTVNSTIAQSGNAASSTGLGPYANSTAESNPATLTQTGTAGNAETSSTASPAAFNVTAPAGSTTSAVSVTTMTSAGGLSLPSTGVARSVPTALPFNCPEDNQKRITNIDGRERFEYLVMCDTAVDTSQEIFTDQVSSPTDCAAVCSMWNDENQWDSCQVATFTPGSDGAMGSCLISGPTSNYVTSPGSVTAVLVAVYTANDNCSSVDFSKRPSNSSVDTSALIASITSAPFSVSTPGFITSSGTGGESQFYTSHGETGTDGIYRYSWSEYYASSTSWYAVYATQWTCSNQIPATIVYQQPNASAAVTTIITGNVTTVISGSAANTYVSAVSGAITPSAVPANATSGGGIFSTGAFTATQTSNGQGGVESPSATSIPSNGVSPQIGTNSTLGSGGSAAVTLSGAFATYNSTAGGGAITPSASGSETNATIPTSTTAGGAEETVSGGFSTANSTGGAGAASLVAANATGSLLVSVTSGGAAETQTFAATTSNSTGGGSAYGSLGSLAQAAGTGSPSSVPINSTGLLPTAVTSGIILETISGQTFTANSTGGVGAITPSVTSGSFIGTVSGSLGSSNSSIGGGSLLSSAATAVGSFGVTISGATATYNSTGGFGTITPSPIPFPSGIISPISSLASGGVVITSVGNTSVVFSTGGGGSILPQIAPSNIISGGSFVGTISGGTSTYNATGGFGTGVPSVSQAPIETSGGFAGTISGSAFTANSTGGFGSGSAPLPFVVPTGTSGGIVGTISGSAFTANSTGGYGSGVVTASAPPNGTLGVSTLVLPPGSAVTIQPSLPVSLVIIPTANVTASGGSANYTVSGETAVILSTGGGGSVLPVPTNATIAASAIPTPSANVNSSSLPSGTGPAPYTSGLANITVSGATAATLVASGSGAITPLANVSLTSAPSVSPSASPNTTTSTGSPFVNSEGNRSGHYSETTTANSSAPVGTGTAPIPTPPFSATPIASLNASSSTGSPFANSEGNRNGHYSESTAANSSALLGTGTAPISSLPSATPIGNFSVPLGTVTAPILTAPPSVTPTTSFNVSTSTGPPFSNSEGNRNGHFSESTAANSSAPLGTGTAPLSTPTANITLWPGTAVYTSPSLVTAPIATAPSVGPVALANSTLLLATGSGSVLVSSANATVTAAFGTGASSGISPTPMNATVVPSTGAAPSSSILEVTNSTTFFPSRLVTASVEISSTANSSLPIATGVPSAVPSPYANSSAPLATGTVVPLITAVPSSVPLIPANFSLPLGTASVAIPALPSSAFLPASANATVIPSLATGNISSIPSIMPTAPPNATTSETCVPTTEVTSIETILVTHVSTIEAPCAATGNVTFPSGTATASNYPGIFGTAPTTLVTATANTTPVPLLLRRLENQTATQEQVDAACANTGNILWNSDFDENTGNNPTGWTVEPQDAFISFETVAPDTANQQTSNATSFGRVSSAAAERTLSVSQPVTMCPNKAYSFQINSRQFKDEANCRQEYYLGDVLIGSSRPTAGTTFSEASAQSQIIGPTREDASKDLIVRTWCAGDGGVATGTTSDGYMQTDFTGLDLRMV